MNQKFIEYLNRPDVKQREFAASLGVREATVSGWKGGNTPSSPMLPKIEKLTKGEVSLASWFLQDTAA